MPNVSGFRAACKVAGSTAKSAHRLAGWAGLSTSQGVGCPDDLGRLGRASAVIFMLRNTFIHLPGVGPQRERALWDQGIL
ncbi:MAG: hypothetical protein ACLQIB_38180, partial [Isosphaeraceae bacterium]